MKLPQNFTALIEEAAHFKLYRDLIGQLNKDLHLATIDLNFDAETLPLSLKTELQEKVFQLMQYKFNEYLSLLYIIDVPETKIKALNSHDLVSLSEAVTFLILQREWQKVWYKRTYK